MSDFSIALSNIIKDNTISVYSLAKTIDCDRTWFQKVMIGERKMNFSNFNNMRREFAGKVDENVLEELYEKFVMDYYGEREYETIQYIKDKLYETRKVELYINECRKSGLNIDEYVTEFEISDDEKGIVQKMIDMMDEEFVYANLNKTSPKLYVYIPSDWQYLKNLILLILNIKDVKGKIDLKYIVNSQLENDIERMQISNFIVSAEFASYGYNTIENNIRLHNQAESIVMLPYYIVTSRKVAMMSYDGKMFVKLEEKNTVDMITDRFEKMTGNMKPFLNVVNPDTYSSIILNGDFDGMKEIFDIVNRICVAAFYTKEILQVIVPANLPNREFIIETMNMVYGNIYEEKLSMYFTIESIRHFMETNETKQEGQYFNLQFTHDVKLAVLNRLYDYYRNGEAEIHMLKAGNYLESDIIHIFGWDEKIVCAQGYVYMGENPVDAMGFVYSPAIARHMSNYNNYMMHSCICLNKENSLTVLKNLITSYERNEKNE